VFRGQRVVVFEWLLSDCLGLLADHADGFGLDEWFHALDKRAVEQHLVIPHRDNGTWVKGQLVIEAQRRGIPLRYATAPDAQMGKRTTMLASALAEFAAEDGVRI
jgi:hypothetical protein